jgi:hypothetical protein
MPRYRLLDGVKIMFTPEEETARDIEEAQDLADRPMRKWVGEIADTDSSMPRFLEDLISSNASLVIPAEMKKRYDDKIKVRSERP